MKDLKRILMAGLMCCIVSAGAFAQKQQNDPKQPPPKEENPKVKAQETKNPPQDNKGKGSDKKKP